MVETRGLEELANRGGGIGQQAGGLVQQEVGGICQQGWRDWPTGRRIGPTGGRRNLPTGRRIGLAEVGLGQQGRRDWPTGGGHIGHKGG